MMIIHAPGYRLAIFFIRKPDALFGSIRGATCDLVIIALPAPLAVFIVRRIEAGVFALDKRGLALFVAVRIIENPQAVLLAFAVLAFAHLVAIGEVGYPVPFLLTIYVLADSHGDFSPLVKDQMALRKKRFQRPFGPHERTERRIGEKVLSVRFGRFEDMRKPEGVREGHAQRGDIELVQVFRRE